MLNIKSPCEEGGDTLAMDLGIHFHSQVQMYIFCMHLPHVWNNTDLNHIKVNENDVQKLNKNDVQNDKKFQI